jgi:hypothetical protein
MEKVSGTSAHVCGTCGKTSTRKGHLCTPVPIEDAALAVCEFCGQTATDPRHVCFPKKLELSFYCDDCGRLATTRSLLCTPRAIPKPKPGAGKKAASRGKTVGKGKAAAPKPGTRKNSRRSDAPLLRMPGAVRLPVLKRGR